MSEAEHVIAAGLLQKPTRIGTLPARLGPDYFNDPGARSSFALTWGYYKRHHRTNALDLNLAQTLLEKGTSKPARALLKLVEEYRSYAPISDPEFKDALIKVAKARRREALQKHGAKALEATLEGDTEAAQQAHRRALLEAEDSDLDDDQPTDIRGSDEIKKERALLASVKPERLGGFDIGFPNIMSKVSMRRRELWILAGYTSDGKTQLSKTLVYNANQNSKARVLYVALEMEKREMMVMFVAQHAHRKDDRGVRWKNILEGTASPGDKKRYAAALDDFEISPDDDGLEITSARGSLHVWAPRREINQGNFRDRVRGMNEDVGLDIVVKDYTELVKPMHSTGQHRLDLKEMCESDKNLAREENVLVMDNHQISRGGRDAAEKRDRFYLLRDLGESAGVERAADGVLWIYTDEMLKETGEAKTGIAKARKGQTCIKGWHIKANWELGALADVEDDV